MDNSYYDSAHLKEFSKIGDHRPELAEKYFAWYSEVMGEGALSAREKALIALAVAHALQCAYCIDSYTQKALAAGGDIEQMTEAVHVSALVRSGATLVHGMQMKDRHDSVSM